MRAVFLLVLFSSCTLLVPGLPAPGSQPLREALWVFDDEVHDEAAQRLLLAYAAAHDVGRLYVSMYQPTENAAGRRLFDEAAIAGFIRQAHLQGIEVWLAYGATTWHELGCRPGTFPYARMQEVLAYNRAHPTAAFDGVMLDLELEEPADLEGLLAVYDEILGVLRPAGVRVAGAVRFFWDRPLARPGDAPRPAYEQFVDLDLDHLVVMAYRNYAGGACPDDGVICLAEAEMAYAHEQAREAFIVVGLRTTSVAADGGLPKTTFHGLSPTVMQREKEAIMGHFSSYRSFGGFAVHQYQRESAAL